MKEIFQNILHSNLRADRKKFHFEVIDVLRINMKTEMIMETKLYLANTVCITSGITYKIILNSKIYDMVLCQV